MTNERKELRWLRGLVAEREGHGGDIPVWLALEWIDDAIKRAAAETVCSCRSPGEMYDRDCPAHGQQDEPSAREWRCFHCDEVFTDAAEARAHFGDTLYRDSACQIPVERFREIEQEITRYRLEDTDLHREMQRLTAEHAVALRREEEKGYARGLKDAGFTGETTAPPILEDHCDKHGHYRINAAGCPICHYERQTKPSVSPAQAFERLREATGDALDGIDALKAGEKP
jgi:hypothetical protein